MKHLAVFFAALAIACMSANANDSAVITSAIEWHDANGAPVPVQRGIAGGSGLNFFDASGNVWEIDGWTGVVSPAATIGSATVYFTSVDCSGAAYLSSAETAAPLAKVTVTFGGASPYVRTLDPVGPIQGLQSSFQLGGSCSTAAIVGLAGAHHLEPVATPQVPFVLPIRPTATGFESVPPN